MSDDKKRQATEDPTAKAAWANSSPSKIPDKNASRKQPNVSTKDELVKSPEGSKENRNEESRDTALVAKPPAASESLPETSGATTSRKRNRNLCYNKFIDYLIDAIPSASWTRCSIVIRLKEGTGFLAEGKFQAKDTTKQEAQRFEESATRVTLLIENRVGEALREESFPFVIPFSKEHVSTALESDIFDGVKRKGPPAVSVDESPDDTNKKPRVSETMRISHRKDVPDDVKELVSLVRKRASKERASERRKVARLETNLKYAEAKAEQTNRIWRENLAKELAKARAKVKTENPAPPRPPPPQVKKPHEPDPEPPAVVTFEERFKQLETFKLRNNHVRVPLRDPLLGRWVASLRASYKWYSPDNPPVPGEGLLPGSTYLTRERVEQLKNIGFEWRVAAPSIPFDQRIENLKTFKQKCGHCDMPRSSYKEDPNLGEWAHQIRRQKQKGELKQERIEKLEEIGFKWLVRTINPTFDERLEECRNFRQTHGHLKIPMYKPNSKEITTLTNKEKSLRMWAQSQRQAYQKFLKGEKTSLDKTRIKSCRSSSLISR